MNYAQFEPEEAKNAKPYVVLVDENNKMTKRVRYEKHGLLAEEL